MKKPPASTDRQEEVGHKPTRKPYVKPRLDRYGALAEISRSIASQTKLDGSGHPNKHFTE